MISCACRIVTEQAPWALVLAHVSCILNSLAGPFVLATPSKLAALWFAPHERTTACSVALMANFLGSATGFLIALPVSTVQNLRDLLLLQAAASVAILLLACLDHCWPALPPLPPSISSAVKSQQHAAAAVAASPALRIGKLAGDRTPLLGNGGAGSDSSSASNNLYHSSSSTGGGSSNGNGNGVGHSTDAAAGKLVSWSASESRSESAAVAAEAAAPSGPQPMQMRQLFRGRHLRFRTGLDAYRRALVDCSARQIWRWWPATGRSCCWR